jgi:hypothetical protein
MLAYTTSRRPVGLLVVSLSLLGCSAFEDNGTLAYVFSTHHAAPVDGVIPNAGEDEQPRVFDNDQGWTITLVDSFITTSSATLVRCDGAVFPLTMFWGPCPEDMREEDLEVLTVAGEEIPPGSYCQLQVGYGPYQVPQIEPGSEETSHQIPESAGVDGSTVYLRGLAERDDQSIEFELRTGSNVMVALDLSQIEGGSPMNVTTDEDFPKELTVAKTYDLLFEGIDFATYDANAYESELPDLLEDVTAVYSGTVIEHEQ